MFPANNIMSSLCYSANGSEVKSVMIGGKFVMRNREFATIDAERVRYEVKKMVDTYL
jgi:5-methylthioadenosine/S-adenosylhomocysteine deaminase